MPAFPQKFNSTVSHWQQTNRGPTSLWNHGRNATLPTEVVDFVIIGGGATGSSLAYHMSRAGGAAEGKSVVVLDAKDLASCASGRNGGHVPVHTWQLMTHFMAPLEEGGAGLSGEEVLDIIMFEQENLRLVESIVQKEGIDADFRKAERLTVMTTPETVEENARLEKYFRKLLAQSTKHKGRTFPAEIVNDPVEARKHSRVKHALAINRSVAGSWHPHRGVTGIMRAALASKHADVKFFSWCPVAGIVENADTTISVDCGPRGTVRARKLVIATSAYSHHLLPELENILTGYRLQAGLVTPPPTFAGAASLRGPYSIEAAAYLIQTPNDGMVFGPYCDVANRDGLARPSEMYGNEDDSVTTEPWRQWLANYCRSSFADWGAEIPGEGLTKIWSGIICHSVDHVPLVGALPGRNNIYMSAGYSGQGMALLVNTTRGLDYMLKHGKWDERVPRSFELSAARLERAKTALHPRDYPEKGLWFGSPLADEAKL